MTNNVFCTWNFDQPITTVKLRDSKSVPHTRIRQAFLVVLKDKPAVDKGFCRTVPSTPLRGDWNNLLTVVRYIYLTAYTVTNKK
jgi:hypothetical protein